jgi:hypothetical protein
MLIFVKNPKGIPCMRLTIVKFQRYCRLNCVHKCPDKDLFGGENKRLLHLCILFDQFGNILHIVILDHGIK